jgi:hypothetical protein
VNPVLDLRALRTRLIAMIGLLAAMHYLILPVVASEDSGPALDRLATIMSLDEERGLGTLAAVGLLALCATTCWFHAKHNPSPGRRSWWLLTGLFAFLAIDEGVAIHEGIDRYLASVDAFGGALVFAWVIPYSLFAVTVGIVSVPFLRRLDRPVSTRLVLGGAVFVAGAAGVELLGAAALEAYGFNSVPYLMVAGLEETLEMAGSSLALLGLLRHGADQPLTIAVRTTDRVAVDASDHTVVREGDREDA